MNVDIRTLALCAGYGGLELGLSAACEHVGWRHRVAAYVEREAYAAALLAHRMETGALAAAPVWTDLTTFDARRWRGVVDCVTAGFPCQPHSMAGARKGTDDDRWIWPAIARIVCESGAWLVVLENVAGLLSSGGFGPVLRDLAEMGFAAEWGCLSAGSVGASHRRERVFIVGYSRLQHQHVQQRNDGAEHPPASSELADALGIGDERQRADGLVASTQSAIDGKALERQRHGNAADDCRARMADASRTHSEGGGQRRDATGWQEQARHAGLGGRGLFAPGPDDSRWPDIIAERPDLAPATEPGVRLLADGASAVVDEYRAHQLRCGGNGVVPLQAAVGIVTLLRRLGIAGMSAQALRAAA